MFLSAWFELPSPPAALPWNEEGMKKHSSKSSKQKRRGQSKKPILEVFWLVLVSGLAPLRLGEPRSFSNSPWVWPGVLDGLTGVLG